MIMMIDDDIVPACSNCIKWTPRQNKWGICKSKQFRLTNGGDIMTYKDFQCIDFDTKLSKSNNKRDIDEIE